MFKLESYVTPYILAYLGKYFKNFDPSDFQMSLWGGGAVFQNLNLNLQVLDEELNLPVTLVSGHIHDLKISVPWTKVTSEPIQVNINTIEITLKLKNLDQDSEPTEGPRVSQSKVLELDKQSAESPPPGYMQNLISKILTNVHVTFENVIVKYVEEDIVLSLNIKRASYCTTDGEWNAAFVDLAAPSFILRKKFLFSDLTVCLDQTNTAGKIETYQEPLLYKCSFEVRIFQQFISAFSKTAHFTRMDFHLEEMDFTVTDEQIPMLMRLYNLLRSLFKISLHEVALKNSGSSAGIQGSRLKSEFSGSTENATIEDEEESVGDGSLLDWGSWAVSWLPPVSALLGEEIEDGDDSVPNDPEEFDRSTQICHYGFYVNKLSVTFKALERICDKPVYGRTIKVRFLPYLKWSLQGITGDFVLRGDEANYVCGVSFMTLDPVGFCPCGIVDGGSDPERPDCQRARHYVKVGKNNSGYAKTSMFALDSTESRPAHDYDFKYEGHVESFSEELMLERTPALAMEYLQTKGLLPMTSEDEDVDIRSVDLSKDKLLTRIVLAPCRVAVCSGFVHRLKLINFAVESYCYEPYGEINKLLSRVKRRERFPGSLDMSIYTNFENAYDVYQVTIIRPNIEIWAADHPEYDFDTRDRHLHQKRRIKTTTPFSHVVPNWPKLVVVAECIDARMFDPNLKFRALIERASTRTLESNPDVSSIQANILAPFTTSSEIRAFGFEVSLVSGSYMCNICIPSNLAFVQKVQTRCDLKRDPLDVIFERFICTDSIRMKFSWAELSLMKVILVSTVQHVERFSEHLITSTLLQDLPGDRNSRMVVNIEDISWRRVLTSKTFSDRYSLANIKTYLEGPNIRDRLPVFEGPAPLPGASDKRFALVILQYPLETQKDIGIGEMKLQDADSTPIFVAKVSDYKIQFEKEVLLWMNYHAQTTECIIPMAVRMGREVKIPLRPMSRSSSRETGRISSGKPTTGNAPSVSDGHSAHGNSSGIDDGVDVNVVYKNPLISPKTAPESSIADSHGSSLGGSTKSSLPGYQLPPKGSKSLEGDFDEQTQVASEDWERWIVSYLNLIKSTYVQIDVGQGELWLPLRSRSNHNRDAKEDSDDSVVIAFPVIHSRPQGIKEEIPFHRMHFPIRFEEDYFGRELFPQQINLEQMYVATIRENVGKEMCSDPLSVLITFSLTTRGPDTVKHPVTTACIHTDISAVNVQVSFPQMLLFIRLAENLLQNAGTFLNLSGSFMPIPSNLDDVDINVELEDSIKLYSDTKSELSSCVDKSIHSGMKTRSNFEIGLKDSSINIHQQTSFEGSSSIPGSEIILDDSIDEGKSCEQLHDEDDGVEPQQLDVKATCWMQMTIGVYRFTILGPMLNKEGEPVEKLVFEVEDIVSSLDIQSVFLKWSHKVSHIRLRNYERNVVPKSTSDIWKLGKTLGIVFSSGEEITREIQILNSTFSGTSTPDYDDRSSLPASFPYPHHSNQSNAGNATPTHQKMRGSLIATMTRVKSTNFHKKSGIPCPVAKWNEAVYKFADKDYKQYAPYEIEDRKTLNEIDIKIRAVDFVFNPQVLEPYMEIFQKISEITVPDDLVSDCSDSTEKCLIPAYNNNTLPLIYLETESIRIFLKSENSDRDQRYKSQIPNFIMLEFASINIASQTDNPLNRTIVKPLLFQMAEKARILTIPGSPVEDRQYQVDFQGVAISTGFWRDIELNSRKMKLRSTVMLKTQGENPALEWNIRTNDMSAEEVKVYPLLERMEFSVGIAPAIVYERNPDNICKSFVVAGHALEVNIVSELKINLNTLQLRGIKFLHTETSKMFSKFSINNLEPENIRRNSKTYKSGEERRRFHSGSSSVREWDSGIDSLAHLPKISHKSGPYLKNVIWNSKRKQDHLRNELHKHHKDKVPIDLLVTSRLITLTLYDLKFDMLNEVTEVIPLSFTMVTQPHFLLTSSQHHQKAEMAVFELSLKLSSGSSKTLWIPSEEEFNRKIFESIPGERNPKTGMVPSFLTFKIMDFVERPCGIEIEISRPTKFRLSRKMLNDLENLKTYLQGDDGIPLEAKSRKIKVVSSTDLLQENKIKQQEIKNFVGKIGTIGIAINQFVVSLVEGPAEIVISGSSATLGARIQNRHNRISEAENITSDFCLNCFSASSVLQNRSTVLMSPFNLLVHTQCSWKPYLEYPMVTMSVSLDPLSFYIGPQNLLAVLQIYNVVKEYINDSIVEEEIIDIMERPEPSSISMIYDSYEDDLRAGTFRFVRVQTSAELPQVYQVAFCETHRTMTWRYPQHRVLTSIEASPVPIDTERPSSFSQKQLDCIVEYWDDAMAEFIFYSAFSLSEYEGTCVSIPSKDKLHAYNSTIWRIKIETPLEESDSKHLVRPEILAACLKVDSIHNSSLVPKLKIYVEVPRISLHLVNNFYFGGKELNTVVKQYTASCLTHLDQLFATINLEMTTFLMSVWLKHCTMDWTSFVNVDVVDYEYLTLSRVVESVLVKMNLCFYEMDTSKDINSELDVISKQVSVKFGSSSLHTILSSLGSWNQILAAWDGNKIHLKNILSLESLNVHQVLILNTMNQQIKFMQSGAEEPTFIRGGECVPFFWPTQKSKPKCKLGLKEKDWAYTCHFDLKKPGYLVRNVHKKPIFIHIANFRGSQRLVTLTGSFFIANALQEDIEVAVLPSNKSSEINWKVGSKAFGCSQIMNLSEMEHFRFRIDKYSTSNPWSSVITPHDLKTSRSRSICVPLFVEDDGSFKTFYVWCTLIEERVEDTTRFLVVLSPFFRVRSFLPSETLVHISTAKEINKENYLLEGKGNELQIDFTGSHEVAHHLTFQANPLGSSSTPSIPLLPEGPTLEMSRADRPIDEILSQITGTNFASCITGNVEEKVTENSWPFISDDISQEEWKLCQQPETALEVKFTTWLEGLPTVLLDVRPWALIINLTGGDLLFSQCVDEKESWSHFTIPYKSVFSPSRFSMQKGRFKLGLELNGKAVRSKKLRFSEEVYRTDVHHVNVDNLIPIDSFSRIDIHDGHQIGYLTVETKMRHKMLVMTVRPTFSIINKTEEEFFIECLSISSNTPQTRGQWTEERLSAYSTLTPITAEASEAAPMVVFNTDGQDYTSHMKTLKYLALSCGGPWWFVRLIDFGIIFDNMNSSNGVPAAAFSVTIPKREPDFITLFTNTLSLTSLEDYELDTVTIPIIVSWTSKDGQVWISLSPDPCPQIILHNHTSVPFLYAQSIGAESVPLQETENFEQYLVLPPNCRSHYTFSQKYLSFPELITETKKLPYLLLTKLPQDVQDFISQSPLCESPCSSESDLENGPCRKRSICERKPHGTSLIPGIGLKWSKELKVDGDASQYFSIGEYVDVKVTVEKLGFTHYVYIENMSNIEVAAKDVRKRIMNQGRMPVNVTEIVSPSKSGVPVSPSSSDCDVTPSYTDSVEKRPETSEVISRCSSKTELSPRPPWEFRLYIPTLTIIVTEDFLSSTERRELLSCTADDLYFEQIPLFLMKPIRGLLNRPKENWSVSIRVGDIQVDSPGFPSERTCDFPVILKQDAEYKKFIIPEKYGRTELHKFFNVLNNSDSFMMSCTITHGQSSLNYQCLETVGLICKPFSLNVEDRLVDFVFPSVQKILSTVQDWLPYLKAIKLPLFEDEDAEFVDASTAWTTVIPGSSLAQFKELFSKQLNSTKPSVVNSQSEFLLAASRQSTNILRPGDSVVETDMDFIPSINAASPSGSEIRIVVKAPSSESRSDSEDVIGVEVNDVSATSVIAECDKKRNVSTNLIKVPKEISTMLENFSHPIHLMSFRIEPLELCLTLRIARLLYLAVDHSRLQIPEFEAVSTVTTSYNLGQALAAHYTTGAIFQIGNPMRLIGSLELLGSPGSLAQSVGTGLKDFVVYPYQGIFQGPTGFVAGLGHGVTSLATSITSGALTSVTNWAWSVSRNIDKLTLDEEEQILTEAARRVQVDGFTDGLFQGLTGFGIRLLGAIGGVVHHPIHNALKDGASPTSVITGFSKGVLGVVTRPIGGVVELVAMTGQGVLRGAGWTPQLKVKGETVVDEIWNSSNSLYKYQVRLTKEDETEQLALVVDAVQPKLKGGLLPISLLLSNKNLYVIDVSEDLVISHFPINLLTFEINQDRNLITLRTTPPKKKDHHSFAKERVIEFVRGSLSTATIGTGLPVIRETRRETQSSTSILRYPRDTNAPEVLPGPSISFVTDTSVPTGITFADQQPGAKQHHRSEPSSPVLHHVDSREIGPLPYSPLYPVSSEEGMLPWKDQIGSQGPSSPHAASSNSTTMFTAISGSARSLASSSSSLFPLYIAPYDRTSGGSPFSELVGEYIASPHDKCEFENVLEWLKRNQDDHFFKV